MSTVPAREFFTAELLAKLGRWADDAGVVKTPERIAASLREHGIGIVDIDRHRHLIDERVYESALLRARAAEEKAAHQSEVERSDG
ncbi:hypothetical protein [Reyranella sp.]|uniref:hypothetical protein n=1 Tax=Reyranella sp. TaxID=1929291 RepID=UPI003D122832